MVVAICLAVFIVFPFMVGCAAKEAQAPAPAPAPAEKTYNCKLQSGYGSASFTCQWILCWMELVTKGLEGRVTFTYYPASSLMGRKQARYGIQQPLSTVLLGSLTFSPAMILTLIILVVFPRIALFLPSIMMGA